MLSATILGLKINRGVWRKALTSFGKQIFKGHSVDDFSKDTMRVSMANSADDLKIEITSVFKSPNPSLRAQETKLLIQSKVCLNKCSELSRMG